MAAPPDYRSLHTPRDSAHKMLCDMASWQCCPTSSLTGGTWQQQQFGTQQLTVGWIKMLKPEADKLCTHSGQHGIFLNLQDAINVRRNIQWFAREPQESQIHRFLFSQKFQDSSRQEKAAPRQERRQTQPRHGS